MTIHSMINMRTAISVLLIGSSLVVVNAQELGQCYYPGAILANDSRPCGPNAGSTLCCPVGWTCFSNEACVVTDLTIVGSSYPLGTTIRGSCTNPRWNDGSCADFCSSNPVFSSTANNGSLLDCGGGNWCCAADTAEGLCDCSSGKGTFTIPQGTAQTIISVSSLVSTETSTPKSTSSMSITSTATKLATITASSSQTTTGVSTTASTQTSPTSESTGAAAVKNTGVTSRLGFKIGVGIGALAVLLGFLAYWFVYRHKSTGRKTDFESRAFSTSSAYTAVTPAYEARRSEYGPFHAAALYGGSPPPVPARNSHNYGAPSPLLAPDMDERLVTLEEEEEEEEEEEDYRAHHHVSSTATLPGPSRASRVEN